MKPERQAAILVVDDEINTPKNLRIIPIIRDFDGRFP
jgi:hypothetical protein